MAQAPLPRVLIIEDEYALAAALATVVRRLGAEPLVAASGQSGLEKLAKHEVAAVLLDIGLPDMSGLKVLEQWMQEAEQGKRGQLPVVMVITAHGSLEHALKARQLGAREYFLKPLDLVEVRAALRTCLQECSHATTQDEALGAAAACQGSGSGSASPQTQPAARMMIGASAPMQRVFAAIAQAAGSKAPVLLSGPHGSGKSLAAQLIHRHGSQGPWVEFRADEHAPQDQAAALEAAAQQAHGGSLLIEELAALPLPLQAMLAKWPEELPWRMMATSSLSLSPALEAGLLREDLFYRLAVLQVELPPLRERQGDLEALAHYWLGLAAPGRELSIAPEAMQALKAHLWPGQVRELVAAMQHAAALCSGAQVLPRHLPKVIAAAGAPLDDDNNALAINASTGQRKPTRQSPQQAQFEQALLQWLDLRLTGEPNDLPTYEDLLAEVERPMLIALLKHFEDKPTRLAAALKMNRATLRRRLRELLGP